MEAKYIISSSNGMSLNFVTKEEYKEYEHDIMIVMLKHYKKITEKYGIYAGNQGKFVKDEKKLNHYDDKYMLNLLKKYDKEIK